MIVMSGKSMDAACCGPTEVDCGPEDTSGCCGGGSCGC
jgi:hypothetical protein